MNQTRIFAVVSARVLLSLLFIVAGFNKLTGISGFADSLGSMGFPAPVAVAYLTALFELVAGLALLVGLRTAPVALALAAFCVVSALLGHVGPGQTNAFLKNLGLTGGFLLLAATPVRAFSLDTRLSSSLTSN